MTIRVVIADDQPLLRTGFKALIESAPDLEVVGEAGDGREAVRLARDLRPDIVLLDLVMPVLSGLEALRELTPAASRVLLLTTDAHNDEVLEALMLGARGVVPKQAATELIFKSIRTVMAGRYWVGRDCVDDVIDRMRERAAAPDPAQSRPTFGLSPRELQVVTAIVAGSTNDDIGTELRISVKTVKHHLTSIFQKLGVANRLELALFAVQHRLDRSGDPIPPPTQLVPTTTLVA